MTATIRLTRYRNGERRISTPIHVQAADVSDALRTASRMVDGLVQGDPEGSYEIVSVEMTGFHGTVCDGSRWFETSAELTARLATQPQQ
jgi:hypothetical protein